MATNGNPYVVNIVPLQGIATGITSSSDTAGQISALQTSVANIQGLVNYDTNTISADFIKSFTNGQTIQITENVNLSSASLYQNGSLVSLGDNTVSSIKFTSDSYISGTASTISFFSAGNDVLELMSTGIQVSGNLTVSQDAYVRTLYQTSDKDKKTNVNSFTTCLDDILKLEPRIFSWKDSGDSDIGFIAQEVQSAWPSLSDGSSIAYSRFIPLLLEGLRELHARVSTLEGLSVK
jgi:hypothetical protein